MTVFDNETHKEVNSSKVKVIEGIIGGKPGAYVRGYFQPRLEKNILVLIDDEVHVAIDINCLDKGYVWAFINQYGYYMAKSSNDPKIPLYLANKGAGSYPYKITKFYNAEYQLENFKGKQHEFVYHSRFTEYLKYTLGVEFEASKGYLPQEKCFQLGLVPLRDGSITSVEYATIVLDRTKLGLLKAQVEELAKYTEFDKECSLHIHLGGYPIRDRYIFALYRVCKNLENYLYRVLPKYTFRTSLYKRTKKDYCRLLPEFKTFNELYDWCGDYNCHYAGSLTQPHPSDEDKRGKWNIQSQI